jgi:hypothetical protein
VTPDVVAVSVVFSTQLVVGGVLVVSVEEAVVPKPAELHLGFSVSVQAYVKEPFLWL